MKTIPLLFVLLLAVGNAVLAQKLHLGPEMERKEHEQLRFLGASSKGICLVSERTEPNGRTELFLEIYNKHLKESSVSQMAKEMPGAWKVVDAKLIQRKIHLFAYRLQDDGLFQLHLFRYDFYGMASGRPSLITEFTDHKGTLDQWASSTDITLNADSTLFVLQWPKAQPGTIDSRRYVLHTIDMNGYVGWSDTLVVEHEVGFDLKPKPILADAQGNLFLSAARCPDPSQPARRVRSIYRFDAEQIKWKRVDLNMGELSAVPILFTFNPQGNLVFAGHFPAAATPLQQDVLFWELSPALEVLREKYSEAKNLFPASVTEKGLVPFTLTHLLAAPEGGYVLLAEQLSTRITNNLTGQKSWLADNVLVARLDDVGAMQWSMLVGKRQMTGVLDGRLNQPMPWMADGSLHLCFNDPPENAANAGHAANHRVMRGGEESGISVVTLPLDKPQPRKKSILDKGESQPLAMTDQHQFVPGMGLVCLTRWGQVYRLGLVQD